MERHDIFLQTDKHGGFLDPIKQNVTSDKKLIKIKISQMVL